MRQTEDKDGGRKENLKKKRRKGTNRMRAEGKRPDREKRKGERWLGKGRV